MGLEKLKSIFAQGVGNNNSQLGGRHGEGGRKHKEHPHGVTKFDDGLGNYVYRSGIDNSNSKFDNFETQPLSYGIYQSSFSLFDDISGINFDNLPNYVNLNDNFRSYPDPNLYYYRSPFISAGNNDIGGLYKDPSGDGGKIDFFSIKNRRKNFFNSPFFSPSGTNLWGGADTNIRDYPSSIYAQTRNTTSGNLWNPDPAPEGQLNIPDNLWPDAPQNIRDGVGTYSPLITQNTSQGPGEYFDSATNLGLRLGKETTWTTLYTANHTKKELNFDRDGERSVNPFQPFSYQNPNIASTFGMGDTAGYSPPNTGLSRGIEPYIISDIVNSESQGGRDINKGSRLIPFNRAKTDLERVGKFLQSPSGLGMIAASNLHLVIPRNVVRIGDDLQRVPQRFNSGYNPLATLLAVSPAARSIGEATPILSMMSGFTIDEEFGGGYRAPGYSDLVGKFNKLPPPFTGTSHIKHKLNKTFEGGVEPSQGGNETGFQQFTRKLSDFLTGGGIRSTYTGAGDKMTLAPIVQGDTLAPTGDSTTVEFENGGETDPQYSETVKKRSYHQDIYGPSVNNAGLSIDVEAEKNGMPMYFKDLRDSSYIFFRAYLEAIAENYTPTWTETQFVGRSELVYTYANTIRDINFTLKLFAQSSKELDAIYAKLNKLSSLCYPEYAIDLNVSRVNFKGEEEQKTRMKPPLARLRLGELYGSRNNEQLGFIRALNYIIPEETTWETIQGKRVPKFVTATIQFQVIHEQPPNLTTDFYGYGRDMQSEPPIGVAAAED